MVWNWDDKVKKYVFELTEPVDTILLGRKMTDGFVSYWSAVMTKPDDPSSIDRMRLALFPEYNVNPFCCLLRLIVLTIRLF